MWGPISCQHKDTATLHSDCQQPLFYNKGERTISDLHHIQQWGVPHRRAACRTSAWGFEFLKVESRITAAINIYITSDLWGWSINEDTAANERDQTRHREGPVEDKHGVQALLTHEVTAKTKVVSLVWTWLTRKRKRIQSQETHQSSLASAVSPAIEMPIWLSTWRIFFWCAASSDWARCTSTQPLISLFFKKRQVLCKTNFWSYL